MTGGASTKALENSQRGIAEGFGSADATLSGQQAQALQGIQAQKEAQQYQTQERLGTQEFGAQEAQKQRSEAARQFNANYGLQNSQFEAAQNQFNRQMDFTYREFNENQKANLLNSMIALDQSGIDSSQTLNQMEYLFNNLMDPKYLKAGQITYDTQGNTTPVLAPVHGGYTL
jgi:hypothetical protein